MTCSSRNEQCCILEHSLVVWLLIKVYDTIIISLRHVHTMKIMCIESKLIHIISVHTNNCALTTIRIECSFDQSTSIGAGGLKPVWRGIALSQESMWVLYIH